MTDKHEHTPGPWAAVICDNEQEWEVVKHDPRKPNAEEPWFVALCYDDADGATAEANARLIAAAPKMWDFIAKRAAAGDAEALQILEAINGNA